LRSKDPLVESGRTSVQLVFALSYVVLFVTIHEQGLSVWLPIEALVLALLLYLAYQGSAFARGCLLLAFSIGIVELGFSAAEAQWSSFTLIGALGYGASCVLLLRPNVTVFLRHQRARSLLPPGPEDDE
jgi:hypothetical protein